MTTRHEAAVQALHGVLSAALPVAIDLDDESVSDVPASGLATMTSGDPEEQGFRIGANVIEWQQDVDLALIAIGPDRRATIESLLPLVGDAVTADPTLGGVVEWTEISGPENVPESAIPGASAARGVAVTFSLFYSTGPNPLEDIE